jgi:uncharacterized membrane protein YtjA (UPF0391 family)
VKAAHARVWRGLHNDAPRLSRVAADRAAATEPRMLKWAIIFAIVSLVTGLLGFHAVSGIAATLAKICFAIFLILFLIALLAVIGVFHLL